MLHPLHFVAAAEQSQNQRASSSFLIFLNVFQTLSCELVDVRQAIRDDSCVFPVFLDARCIATPLRVAHCGRFLSRRQAKQTSQNSQSVPSFIDFFSFFPCLFLRFPIVCCSKLLLHSAARNTRNPPPTPKKHTKYVTYQSG